MMDSVIKWGTLAMATIGAGTGSVALVKSCKNKKRLNNMDFYQNKLENDITSALEAINTLSAPAPVVEQPQVDATTQPDQKTA